MTFAAVCNCLLDHRLTDEAIECSSIRSPAVNQRGKSQTDGEDSTDQTGKVSGSIIGAGSPKASQLKGVRRDDTRLHRTLVEQWFKTMGLNIGLES